MGIEPVTLDDARVQTAATLHHYAMEDADRADVWIKRERPDLAISSLLSAASRESQAAQSIDMMSTPHEPARTIYYRSAAALAHQACVVLAEQGLRGEPDGKLRAELEELAK